jgi:hypothetical protein
MPWHYLSEFLLLNFTDCGRNCDADGLEDPPTDSDALAPDTKLLAVIVYYGRLKGFDGNLRTFNKSRREQLAGADFPWQACWEG